MYVRNLNYVRNGTAYAVCARDVPGLQGFCMIYTYTHIITHTYSDVPPLVTAKYLIYTYQRSKTKHQKKNQMTLTFRNLGTKNHHSIWCLLTLYVLVPFSVTFVLSGGLEFVSSSSFFPWLSLQKSHHHITCHSLRCCPGSNSVSLVSPPKFPDWDFLYCFDIPLL